MPPLKPNPARRLAIGVAALFAIGGVILGLASLDNVLWSYCGLWLLWIVGPAIMLLAIRTRGIPPGHCQSCGYDLEGNTSGKCPECGTPLETEARP